MKLLRMRKGRSILIVYVSDEKVVRERQVDLTAQWLAGLKRKEEYGQVE